MTETLRDSADHITIDVDEDGFHLFVVGLDGNYDIHLHQNVALELEQQVKNLITPWADEGGRK